MAGRGAEEPARALEVEQGERADVERTEAVGPLKLATKEASAVKSAWAANAAKRMQARSSPSASPPSRDRPANSIVNSTKPLHRGD